MRQKDLQRGRRWDRLRDAIVYGYDWAAGNAVERLALGLSRIGVRVLHCDRLPFHLRGADTELHELEPNLYTFKASVPPSRLNRFPGMTHVHVASLLRQIFGHADALGMEQPVFLYANAGGILVPLCQAMKDRGCLRVFVAMDYTDSLSPNHVGQSDLTVVFSKTAYQRMHARWGEKIHHIPHGINLKPFRNVLASPENPPEVLAENPRPRLGYAGSSADEFLNTRVLRELLERRRDWSFISFHWSREMGGARKAVPLPNAYLLPWQAPEGFARCVSAFDVGFMPYDCSNVVLYNGPPMKLWDYFALGLPVVATPLVHLWEYDGGLVYLGETAKELESAVEKALAEPVDSPLRAKRKQLAEEHSVEALGRILERILS